MTTTKYFLLFSLALIIGFFIGLNFIWVANIVFYGTIAGPCVWPSDYEAMGYGSVDDLVYDNYLQCYLKP